MPTPLEDGNDLFHHAYDRATEAATDGPPILVVFADKLLSHRRTHSLETSITTPAFETLKNVAHVPVAAFSLAKRYADTGLDDASLEPFRALLAVAIGGRAALGDLEPEPRDDADRLLGGCAVFLSRVIDDARVDSELLASFAAAAGVVLERLSTSATDLVLTALHAATETVLASFDPEERRTFQVVVAGSHQARERNFGTQYFRQRLAEREEDERRVLYAEGATSLNEALEVVAKQRADRQLAKAFFGDDARMQRDLLGDAAAALLTKHRFAPIESPTELAVDA